MPEKAIMAWFSETFITNQSSAVTETRIIAGTVLGMAILVTLYLLFRVLYKYSKKSTEAQVERAVRLNNVRTQE